MTDPTTLALLTSFVGSRPAYLATLRLAVRLADSRSRYTDKRTLKISSRSKTDETKGLSADDFGTIIRTLERWGLIERVENNGGLVRWWTVTDLGRAVLDNQPLERR